LLATVGLAERGEEITTAELLSRFDAIVVELTS
jgi:hypothetical protein